MSKTNLAANLPATESSLHRENLEFLKGLPAVIIGFIVALALFLMPIYIDLEIKHVFNAAK